MLSIKTFTSEEELNKYLTRTAYIDFLHKHLERFGDSKEAISKSIDYAFSDDSGKGGFLIAGYLDDKLIAGVIMNKTGMSGYIPDYILVYVAVDSSLRGKGIGRQVIEETLKIAGTDVALHVEYDNPAKGLYERIGFTTKYAEMRFSAGE